MHSPTQDQVRDLAYHIWVSAGEEYGRALDFWLMAEQMVVEMSVATTRFAKATFAAAQMPGMAANGGFSELYISRTRDLAYAMWEAAEQQVDWTMDFWLAAEQHTRAITQAAARTAGSAVGANKMVSQAFEAFSAEQYLDRIRRTAYAMWEAAGRQYGRSLDFWLAAEKQVLQSMTPVATGFEPQALREAAARSEIAMVQRPVGPPPVLEKETPKSASSQIAERTVEARPGSPDAASSATAGTQQTAVRREAEVKPRSGTTGKGSKRSRR
jgi:hypothetical protein